MKHNRPVNLNLFTIRFPIPAIVSILHRISGVFLFLFIPCALWLLELSLTPGGFAQIQEWQSGWLVKLLTLGILAAFLYHLVAGVRHLLSDLHIGDTLRAGRLSAQLVFVVSILLVILAGVWLW